MNDLRFARVPNRELERRWALLRRLMEERALDALLTLASDDDHGGYVRWFSDEPVNSYRRGLILPRGEDMIAIEHGGMDQQRGTNGDPDYRGIAEVFTTAEFPSVDYSLGYEADIATALIRKHGFRTIGMVGTGNMPHRFVERLQESARGAAFADVTDMVDAFMVAKSADEVALIRESALIQDRILETVLAAARPGMRDIDVTAIARAEALKAGGVGGIILAGSGPQGTFAPFRPPLRQNRVIEKGDYLSLLIENSGVCGYFTELARTIVFGKASADLRKWSDAATEMQAEILVEFKPGATARSLFDFHNRQRARHGLPPENRIFAHGQGYNLVERPLIRDDEPMSIEAGMNLAIHPTIADGGTVFAVMCDNFLVGRDGARERLHRTEQRIFEV
jgi:Xaa-Pro aminopeptidase